MAASFSRYRSTNTVIIKVFKRPNIFTSHISESEYRIFHNIVSMFVNILNKKGKNEIKAVHMLYRALRPGVCLTCP